jgi:hypothetical protein
MQRYMLAALMFGRIASSHTSTNGSPRRAASSASGMS